MVQTMQGLSEIINILSIFFDSVFDGSIICFPEFITEKLQKHFSGPSFSWFGCISHKQYVLLKVT